MQVIAAADRNASFRYVARIKIRSTNANERSTRRKMQEISRNYINSSDLSRLHIKTNSKCLSVEELFFNDPQVVFGEISS